MFWLMLFFLSLSVAAFILEMATPPRQHGSATLPALLILAMAIACASIVHENNSTRITTFGTARAEVRTDGSATAETDGTNLAAVISGVIRAAKQFFTGGGDVVVNVPAAPPATPAP